MIARARGPAATPGDVPLAAFGRGTAGEKGGPGTRPNDTPRGGTAGHTRRYSALVARCSAGEPARPVSGALMQDVCHVPGRAPGTPGDSRSAGRRATRQAV